MSSYIFNTLVQRFLIKVESLIVPLRPYSPLDPVLSQRIVFRILKTTHNFIYWLVAPFNNYVHMIAPDRHRKYLLPNSLCLLHDSASDDLTLSLLESDAIVTLLFPVGLF